LESSSAVDEFGGGHLCSPYTWRKESHEVKEQRGRKMKATFFSSSSYLFFLETPPASLPLGAG
jgi:hypothetical protein